MIKAFLTTIFIVLLSILVFFPKTVSGQGYFKCQWVANKCVFPLTGEVRNCDANYRVPFDAEEICASIPDPNAQPGLQAQQCADAAPACIAESISGGSLPIDLKKLEAENEFRFAGQKLADIINFLLLRYIFVAAGLLLLVYLIFGGLQLMLSQGDPKGIEEAKSKITNALVGFLIVFASYWIVIIAGEILGIKGIKDVFR